MKPVRWRLWPLVGSPVFVFWPGHVGAGAHAHRSLPARDRAIRGSRSSMMSHLIELMNIFSLVDYDPVSESINFLAKVVFSI